MRDCPDTHEWEAAFDFARPCRLNGKPLVKENDASRENTP